MSNKTFVTRLKDALITKHRCVRQRRCIVGKDDLQELLYYFTELDNQARERHNSQRNMEEELKLTILENEHKNLFYDAPASCSKEYLIKAYQHNSLLNAKVNSV